MTDTTLRQTDRRVLSLGPARHTCHGCGNCCSGWKVRMADDSERVRVERQALELEVADPIVDGELRQENGVCAFLGDDRLCRIHARFGLDEKPITCQLFPRRSVQAEDGVRFGVDPGCASTWRSLQDGPELSLWFIPTGRDQHLAPGLAAVETKLIKLARAPAMTIARLASAFSQESLSRSGGFPVGLGTRLLDRARFVVDALTDPENGPLVNADLAPLVAFLRALDQGRPLEVGRVAPFVLAPALEPIALDTLQRTLFLRLGGEAIPPSGHALVVLAGVLASALTDPRPERFGPTLAAWSRVSRVDGFWKRFAKDTDTARWILRGS